MEKILIKGGRIVVYDTDTNSIGYCSPTYAYSNEMYSPQKNGQVITQTQVIDVNAGDIIISLRYYSNKEHKEMTEVMVITDKVAAYDLNKAIEKMKYHIEYKEEKNESC